jgi:hypothetical protein
LSASAERRMPRREGEVLRLGTAIEVNSNRKRAARPRNKKRGSYTQLRRSASRS